MEKKHKILLLDDDPDLLELYKEMLGGLPSKPEIHTATSGSRAMALLESDPFRLLICDLKMPRMDGLQVLSIVRRKYPALRTVALTSVPDEQFRSRAYALGVDLFWHKPGTEQEIKMFLECLESLLGQETESGFRGVQSKSLVDIIQLECISQSSSVLRITNGPLTGKIWIQNGEVTDAEAGEQKGEAAFHKILSWKTGNFESLPAEPDRPKTILKSYSGLLLESAQALDESRSENGGEAPSVVDARVTALSKVAGVEFVLTMEAGDHARSAAHGLENPERMASWARQSLDRFGGLGDRLHTGPLERIEGFGPQRHVTLARQATTEFCIGWKHSLVPEEVRQTMKKVLEVWAS